MVANQTWVMLSYRMPREPSTPRIAVWRRLKALGVAQLGDGLVALPYDSSTKESLEWVANSVLEADGDASIWIATPTVRRFGARLAEQMTRERIGEYTALIDRVGATQGHAPTTRELKSMRAELRRIERRDHFPPPERAAARQALAGLEASPAAVE